MKRPTFHIVYYTCPHNICIFVSHSCSFPISLFPLPLSLDARYRRWSVYFLGLGNQSRAARRMRRTLVSGTRAPHRPHKMLSSMGHTWHIGRVCACPGRQPIRHSKHPKQTHTRAYKQPPHACMRPRYTTHAHDAVCYIVLCLSTCVLNNTNIVYCRVWWRYG